jgi:short subunit dehydrogenase-like uncharacterized protein
MEKNKILVYGANGYTGQLIARYAASWELQPVLAGRNAAVIRQLAGELSLPSRIFSLDNADELHRQLEDVKVVIHAAGPFIHTARQMVEACIATGTHYMDINGDLSVFEFIRSYDQQAKEAGVMLLPGAGFDVVPTDCLALQLKEQMPDATRLQLAFVQLGGQISHGTATTMAGKAGEGGAVREKGKIVRKPLGQKGMWLRFEGKPFHVMTIPWGDVSTAYHTTGIPDIETYTGMKPLVFYLLKAQFLFNWLLRTKFVRQYIQRKINARPAGPSDAQRAKARTYVWGKVQNVAGQSVTGQFVCSDGYTLTADSCLALAKEILKGYFRPGYQTPAAVYGADFIYRLPGTRALGGE